MHMREVVQKLVSSILSTEGSSDPAVRRAAVDYGANTTGLVRNVDALPSGLSPYLDKLIDTPYKIVDADIAALKDLGLSEDEIFEITVSASVGAAQGRLDRLNELIADHAA